MASTKAINDYKRGISSDFSEEISNWLFDIYLEHGNQISKPIYNSLKKCPDFFLAVSEEDYKSIAESIFPPLIKKYKYLIDFDDELFELLKQMRKKFLPIISFKGVCETFDNWIDETKEKYGVDLILFAEAYNSWWYTQKKLWGKGCEVSDKFILCYDWRHSKNPFGIESAYSRYQNRPFIEGHKRDLELLLIYADNIEPWFDWQKKALKEYIQKFLKAGKGEAITYKEAAAHELGTRWKYLISENPDDVQWKAWKDEFISGNIDGTMRTFLAFAGDEIVGDVTLKSENSELFALRINPEYQGHGIATGLVKHVESWAIKNGLQHLLISVEPNQTRIMQIFFHWGFDEFVLSENNLLLYKKTLKTL